MDRLRGNGRREWSEEVRGCAITRLRMGGDNEYMHGFG